MPNYATKSKDVRGIHTSISVKKIYSVNLKSGIYRVFFDNLKTTPVKKQVM